MKTETVIQTLSNEIRHVLDAVDSAELDQARDLILNSGSIFIQGSGRSGLVGKMIAMRLMHSDFSVHVAGETTTPSLKENDLLIVLSGSGKGSTLNHMIQKVRDLGGRTLLVTASDDKAVTDKFDASIFINASTKNNDIETIQPLGNQFDQAMHIILDALVISVNQKTGRTNDELKARHFNLE